MSNMAARDTTFDNIGPIKSVWVSLSNCHTTEDYVELAIEINGVRKVLSRHYGPGLTKQEGMVSESHQITWILNKANSVEFILGKENE